MAGVRWILFARTALHSLKMGSWGPTLPPPGERLLVLVRTTQKEVAACAFWIVGEGCGRRGFRSLSCWSRLL